MRSFLLTEGLKLVTYTWLLSELSAVVRSKIKFLILFSYTEGNLHTYVILFSVVFFSSYRTNFIAGSSLLNRCFNEQIRASDEVVLFTVWMAVE